MALFRRILCQFRGFEAVRFCSSDQNQPRYFNKNFPEFTTHGKHSKDFGNFITRPDLATWSRVLLGSPPGYGDIDGVKGQDLIEGSLHAISSVTQSLSQNKVTDLSELLTPVCYEKLNEILQNDPNFQTPESQYALNVEHSDLFFAWMHAFVKNDRLNIVALSFPELETFKKWVVDYEESMKEHRENVASTIKKDAPPDELRDKILDYTENKKAAVHRINNHLKSNDIIISNWNFILVIFSFIINSFIYVVFLGKWRLEN